MKVDYGIDAPGVVRNLADDGRAADLASLLVPPFHVGGALVDLRGFWITGSVLLSRRLDAAVQPEGKVPSSRSHAGASELRGDEDVLDVGTGRGLLLVGAAKRLVTGRAVGLDIWKTSDLSGNARDKTQAVLGRKAWRTAAGCWSGRRRIPGCPMQVSM